MEESPIKRMVGGNAGANGLVEREVQEVEGRMWALLLGLQKR